MVAWLISDGALWFSVPALVGTAYFALQLLAGQIGGDLDLDADVEFDADQPSGDPGQEVGVLSLQTLSAFGMGAGWMGLATLRATELGFWGATVIALASGVAIAWMLLALMRTLLRLQSSGNVNMRDIVGSTGSVYIAVPPAGAGSGRVTCVLGNRQRRFDAVQTGADAIASKTQVRILDVNTNTNTLTIEAMNTEAVS
ncbi:MAG: hypothetical protein AAF297_07685 [Planctomycetota bacterium]